MNFRFQTIRPTRGEYLPTLIFFLFAVLILVYGSLMDTPRPVADRFYFVLNLTIALLFYFPLAHKYVPINPNNTYISLTWVATLVVLVLTSFVKQFGTVRYIFWLPLAFFCYYHIMRGFYLLLDGNVPSFQAASWTVGKVDKASGRVIKESDIVFNLVYSFLPIIIYLGYVFYKQMK